MCSFKQVHNTGGGSQESVQSPTRRVMHAPQTDADGFGSRAPSLEGGRTVGGPDRRSWLLAWGRRSVGDFVVLRLRSGLLENDT